MFAKLFGYLSMAWGAFCVLKPEFLRDRFAWKTARYFFWLVMGVYFFPLFHFFGKRAGIAGVFIFFAAIWIGMRLMRRTLREAFGKVPLAAFQVVGALSFLSGAALVWWPKK